MIEGSRNIKTFHRKKRKLLNHFKSRAANPPLEALPWSGAWEDYCEEMREIERQLVEMGVVF